MRKLVSSIFFIAIVSFSRAQIVNSPATISIDLQTGADTIIYLRSMNSGTQKVSRIITTELRSTTFLLSAGLLDKTKWQLDGNDEFNYDGLPQYVWNADFGAKWYLTN